MMRLKSQWIQSELEIEKKTELHQGPIDIIDVTVNIDYKSMYKRTPFKNWE